jgi:large subunit ribosomal protein L5
MENYVPTLKKKYDDDIVGGLKEKFGYKSPMEVPTLEKIILNQGIGDAVSDKRLIENSVNQLSQIAGQKAVPTYSTKDISNFKLRKAMPIGAKVTLRGYQMYEFLERLVAIALPRVRDFRGIKDKFDGRGNYTLGIQEHIIFPEINLDKIDKIVGMDITFVTTAKTDEEGYELLKQFGLPFKNAKND